MTTYDLTSINLEDNLSTHWAYPPQQCYNYSLLHGSLSINNDLKIESLDEVLISNDPTEIPSSNSKKRKAEQEDINFVKLTREQLLVMSSQEFEERIRILQNMRPFTLAEEEEIKRQRKLIKNREYAQTSRIKKRETLSSLQVQLTAVNTENQILKSHITNLTQQVQYLQIENHQLRMMFSSYPPSYSQTTTTTVSNPSSQSLPPLAPPSLSTSPDGSFIYSEVYPSSPSLSTDDNELLGVITSDSDDTSLPMEFPNTVDPFSFDSGKNWVTDNYTAGLCLLVILFSFGLFFNGVLLEGISVMVSPMVGTSATTSRTLFNFIDDESYDGSYKNNSVIESISIKNIGKSNRENIGESNRENIGKRNIDIPGLWGRVFLKEKFLALDVDFDNKLQQEF
jgi:hypothetical protein